MKEMRWTPWNPRAIGVATEESMPTEPKPLVKRGTTYEAPASRRKAARELQAFHAKCGRTTYRLQCLYVRARRKVALRHAQGQEKGLDR